MKMLLSAIVFGITGCSTLQTSQPTANPPAVTPGESTSATLVTPITQALPIAFEVKNGILHPESALYSPEHNLIFISNIASGNPFETKRVGYISKVSPKGKVLKAKWVKGLKAPKGMAVHAGFLWVSDVDQVVKIDIKSGKVDRTYTVPGAKFLNDVAVDSNGNVYISDMLTDTIHRVEADHVTEWMKSPKLRGPNGIYIDGDRMVVSLWGSEMDPKTFATKRSGALAILSIQAPSESFLEQEGVRGNLDGISAEEGGTVWVSDWMTGDVFKIEKEGQGEKAFNLKQGAADLSVARGLKLLLVPQMSQNKVIAFKLSK